MTNLDLKSGTPTVARYNPLDMQVCVPKSFTDEQVLAFARANGGTEQAIIRREGSAWLAGDPERAQCLELADHVHVMLDLDGRTA